MANETSALEIIAVELASRKGGSIALRHDQAAAQAIVDTLSAQGFAIVPLKPSEAMIDAGWIDKEDVNPDDIWAAMIRTYQEKPDAE